MKTLKKSPVKNTDIVITRMINAPQKKVFEALTTPKHIKQWWGPEHFTAPHIEVDLRPEGHYLYCMEGPDGKQYWSGGVFKEVEIPGRVVLTDYFADDKGNKIDPTQVFGADSNVPKESVVAVTFEDVEGKTKLSIHYTSLTEAEKDALMKVQFLEGWQTSLDKFSKYVQAF